MKKRFSVLLICVAAGLSACAVSQPEVPPTVTDAELSAREISPGDNLGVSFDLEVAEPTSIERIYLRGLPKNSLFAGTQTDLHLPSEQRTSYDVQIVLEIPATSGQYNMELVVETTGKTYSAPLGALAVRDTPSRIVHAQFVPGSHAASDCYMNTKLLALEYTVVDDNGASDFVVPALVPASQDTEDLVFFPHWESIGWLGGKQGIMLNRPTSDMVKEQLVSSDIRINCEMSTAKLYETAVKGQDLSRLTGKPTVVGSEPVRYYIR
jgi:hypothetical protein